MAEVGSNEPPRFTLETSTDPVRQRQWQARQDGKLTDFQIVVIDTRIPCHKLILAGQSEYFNCMFQQESFTEVQQGYVDLKELDVDAVKLVVDFMYSGRIEFDHHMVEDVLKCIDRFQLTDDILKEKICEYIIPNICPENSIGWFRFGDQMNLETIKTVALVFMLRRCNVYCSELVSLSFEEVREMVKKVTEIHSYHDRSLKVFVTWAMHDANERCQKFEEILKVIDLSKCSSFFLKDIYQNYGKVLLHNFDLVHQFTAALISSVPELKGSIYNVIVSGGCEGSNANHNRKTWLLNLNTGYYAEKATQPIPEGKFDVLTWACPDGLICGVESRQTNNLFLYHKNTDTWIKLPTLHSSPRGVGATCVQGVLFVVVGTITSSLDLRRRKAWDFLSDAMHQGMVYPIVGAIQDCVYVIFSTHPDNARSQEHEITLQCYDTTTNTWSIKASLPDSIKETCGAQVVTIADKLYLVGGAGRLCAKYDPESDVWTILKRPSRGHMNGAALELNGKIILSGGKKGEAARRSIEEYDPSTDSWRMLPVRLPARLFNHCMIPL